MNYCPETFSQTEFDFAVEICEAVKAAWGKAGMGEREKIIFNMPATVEVAPPNHYADQVEYFATHITEREKCILSAHPHNDRGCGVAAAELALMAGADRVEGCLLGQGERTGNVDIITLALNMYSQGVCPKLDFSDLPAIKGLVERCTGMPCPDRYPYAGKLVFAAFAGTHQDAIKKGLDIRAKKNKNNEKAIWAVPYLAIDPEDLGCSYAAVIRVNSQSGRAGAAYLVKQSLSLDMPRPMQAHFGKVIQRESDKTGTELTSAFVTECFKRTYHLGTSNDVRGRLFLKSFRLSTVSPSTSESASDDSDSPHDLDALDAAFITSALSDDAQVVRFEGEITVDATPRNVSGVGSSPISALLHGLQSSFALKLKAASLNSHTLGPDDSQRASYVELSTLGDTSKQFFGVGVSSHATASRLRAVISAANTSLPNGHTFPAPRRPRSTIPSRPSSAAGFKVEDLVLRTGIPPRGIDPSEWRQGVHAT